MNFNAILKFFHNFLIIITHTQNDSWSEKERDPFRNNGALLFHNISSRALHCNKEYYWTIIIKCLLLLWLLVMRVCLIEAHFEKLFVLVFTSLISAIYTQSSINKNKHFLSCDIVVINFVYLIQLSLHISIFFLSKKHKNVWINKFHVDQSSSQLSLDYSKKKIINYRKNRTHTKLL